MRLVLLHLVCIDFKEKTDLSLIFFDLLISYFLVQ